MAPNGSSVIQTMMRRLAEEEAASGAKADRAPGESKPADAKAAVAGRK